MNGILEAIDTNPAVPIPEVVAAWTDGLPAGDLIGVIEGLAGFAAAASSAATRNDLPTAGQTAAAPVDALLIARAFLTDDDTATQLLLKHCDPYSTTLQLAGWLRTALAEALEHGAGAQFGETTPIDVLNRWIQTADQGDEQ
jgi:hypothetical protein